MKGSNLAKTKLQNPNASAARTSNSPKAPLSTAEIFRILHKWGIHTLGQLAALNKEEIRARLGTEAVRLWKRANGRSNRLLKFVLPPEAFDESFEFDHEIETAEPLLFMLRRFLEQLAVRLSAIYLVAKELTLRISFSNSRQDERTNASAARTYERVFEIPQPTNDVDLLFRMLQTHLENFKSQHPIIAVALTAQPIRPASQQFGLFETALRNPNQLFETLARLTALLGTDRVGTPVLEETHRPDAFQMEPFMWDLNAYEFPHCRAGARAPLPEGEGRVRAAPWSESPRKEKRWFGAALRRFRPAPTASVLLDEDIPAHLQSEKIRGKVIDQRGPYLLSGNWWDEKSWARAEWDMQLENGDLVRAHEAQEQWCIDGIYD